MIESLLKPVLVLVIGFALRFALEAIGVQLDEAVFNSIVAALVAFLLAQFGVEGAYRAGFLKRG